ncbi:phage holin family protein [Deinococcus planocerae]|uniref:phage holin family protein n=1 Tax=Deinococcus planocerae TaxID=1737569 RepID=UPI001FEA4BB7|nr:phage holin family protein [Deinococcus planocerae]
MQEERKSMGGALVDVFDAGVTLVKAEVRNLLGQVTAVVKAKGIGVVLLLASVGPLVLGLIFLILAVFYALIALGLPAWASALIIGLLSLGVTAGLILFGLRRLSAQVPQEEGLRTRGGPLSEDEELEARYQAEQAARSRSQTDQGDKKTVVLGGPTEVSGRAAGGAVVAGTTTTTVNLSTGQTDAVPAGTGLGGSGNAGAGYTGPVRRDPGSGALAAGSPDTPDQQGNMRSSGLPDTGTRGNAIQREMEEDRQRGVVRPGLNTSGFTSGEAGVNASDRGEGIKDPLTEREGVSQGVAVRGTDAGEVRLPVYEATESGEPQVYGSGLNKKIDGSEAHDAGADGHGGHDQPDPNVRHPVVLKDAPGISVSTEPTFQDDMKKEGY